MEQKINNQTTDHSLIDIQRILSLIRPRATEEINLHQQYVEVRLVSPLKKPKRYFLPIESDMEARLQEIIDEAKQNVCNIYIGIALRDTDKSGKDQDCSWLTFLVVDYDEVDGVKIKDIEEMAEREAARKKVLTRIQDETELPPTMIVDSGNGFHVYLALDRPVNIRKNADAIKRKVKWLAGRYSDIPGDLALLRISQPIRLPGSLNFKNPASPLPCHVLAYYPERIYTFADIPEAKLTLLSKRKAMRQVTQSKKEAAEYQFESCAFIRWMIEHPEEQTYDLWFAAANILAYFGEKGRKAFHRLSCGYHGYSEEETEELFNKSLQAYQQGIGPITYDKLAQKGFDERDDTEAASPAIYIKEQYQEQKLSDMGLSYDKKGKLHFNPNVFADYIMKTDEMAIQEGTMFYQYEGGVWVPLPEYKIRRKIRVFIQEAKENVYRNYMAKDAIEMLRDAVPEMPETNKHKNLVNLLNGMLDMNTLKLCSHDSAYYSTVQIPIAYDDNAKCERFEKFVDEVMESDMERMQVLQELVGYILSSSMVIQKGFFLFGEGSNGKSLLLDLVTMLVGRENVSNLSLQDLENPFQRASLIGKAVNIATENEINPKGFNSQYFKAVISGDGIQVDRKHKDPVNISPTCKFIFAVNNLPYSPDRSHGLYRRIFILPFNRRFDGKEADKYLKQKLIAELPGILNWALAGLKRLTEQNFEFTQSAVIAEASNRYKQEQNPMLNFMEEILEKTGPGDRISRTSVIDAYQIWCRRNGLGEMKMSHQKFWSTFKANCKELDLPYELKISNGVRYQGQLSIKRFADNKDCSILT